MHKAVELLEAGVTIRFYAFGETYFMAKRKPRIAYCFDSPWVPEDEGTPHHFSHVEKCFTDGSWKLLDLKKIDHINRVKQHA